MGLSGTICDYLGPSVTIWDYLGVSETIWEYLGLSGTTWDYLGLSGTILDYLGLSGTIWNYLGLSWTREQVEAGETKLLVSETFWFFFFLRPTGSIEELALLKIKIAARGPQNG